MFGLLTDLTRSALAVAVAPVALVADVVTLPATAYEGKPAFGTTESVLKQVGIKEK